MTWCLFALQVFGLKRILRLISVNQLMINDAKTKLVTFKVVVLTVFYYPSKNIKIVHKYEKSLCRY